jgi:sec-independent protein translocase protein TatA
MSALLALPEGGEWIVILVIVVLVFGANKLPELTRNAARAMNEFKKITGKDADDEKTADATASGDDTAKPKQAADAAPAAAETEAAKPKQDSPPA